MAKKKSKNNQNLFLLAIVAIVAVVGIVVLILNSGSVSLSNEDLAGEATYGMKVGAGTFPVVVEEMGPTPLEMGDASSGCSSTEMICGAGNCCNAYTQKCVSGKCVDN